MCHYVPESGQKQDIIDISKDIRRDSLCILFASQNFLIEEEIIQGLLPMAHFQKDQPVSYMFFGGIGTFP